MKLMTRMRVLVLAQAQQLARRRITRMVAQSAVEFKEIVKEVVDDDVVGYEDVDIRYASEEVDGGTSCDEDGKG